MTTTPETTTTKDQPHVFLAGLAQQGDYAFGFAKAGHTTEALEHAAAIERLIAAYRRATGAVKPQTERVQAVIDAIGPTMLLGLQDAELFDEPGRERIQEWVRWIAETVAVLPALMVEQQMETGSVA